MVLWTDLGVFLGILGGYDDYGGGASVPADFG